MTQENANPQSKTRSIPTQSRLIHSHYAILGLHPSASVIEIRRAYRELSKTYHPDTTTLPSEVATRKFQRLNEAYGIISNPERRSLYDLQIGYSRWNVIQIPTDLQQSNQKTETWSKSAYLDPNDRPLSAGEIFSLCLLALTLLGCLGLAFLIAWLRGDSLAIAPSLGFLQILLMPQIP
ncbi:MAG: J domain-containing protein [Snowella sp.]|nr:J domain-containing protein [Snowella sp.]PZV28183.1 MAG: molecular chaperone DnaJ [Snowella sp.]